MMNNIERLLELKEEDDQSSFKAYIAGVFPGIERYVKRQLDLAIRKNSIQKGNCEVADVMDQLYINTFEHIHEISEKEDLKIWMFQEAERILNDAIVEEEFDEYFFKNLNNYTQDEWAEMEEKYTIDGDGDFVMEEELDDPSYNKNDYELDDVFIQDDTKDIITALDNQLTQSALSKHMNLVLPRLPRLTASILELYSNQKMKAHEIAKIKGLDINEVLNYLEEAKKMISMTLKNRFLD